MRKISSFWMTFLIIFSSFMVIFMGNISALNDAQNLSGIVWQSNGDNPTDITEFCVWVEHNSIWYRYPETGWANTNESDDGLWWYSFVLPDLDHGIKWDDGDIYRIQVNGEPWGDINGNTTSNGTGSSGDPFPTPYNPSIEANKNNTINYIAGGGFANEQQWDVRTMASIDLIPTNITLNGYAPDPLGNPVPPSSQVSIIFNVTNLGSTDSGDFNVTLYNYSLALGQNIGPPFAIINVPSVPPVEDSDEQLAYWFSSALPGEYYVNLTVDSDYVVPEYDEENNRVILFFKIGPNLVLNNITVDFNAPTDPIYVGPGQEVQINAICMNIGDSSTGVGSKMALYNITGPNGTIILGSEVEKDIPILVAGASSAVQTWTWIAPWSPGDFYINLSVDFGHDIVEANEDDNNFTIHFNVPIEPVTTIRNGTPTFPYDMITETVWYMNGTTELSFEVWGFNPPIFIWYRITDLTSGLIVKDWSNYTAEGAPFNMVWGEGPFKIEFNSTDSAGAQETTREKTIIVDNSEPLTSIDIGSPKYQETISDNWNITSATDITLSSIDYPPGLNTVGINNASGINNMPQSGIFYRIQRISDGVYVQDWTETTISSIINDIHTAEPFTLPSSWSDGLFIIEINSIDNLKQVEISSITVNLDNDGPTSDITSDSTTEKYTGRWEISESTLFTLTADDGLGSGVLRIWYRLDNMDWHQMAWSDYVGPLTISEMFPGVNLEDILWNHTIYIGAEDNLGNNGTLSSLLIYVEGDIEPPEPPVLRLVVSNNDVVLEWDPSPAPDIDYYLIYRSTTKTGFDFSNVWVDTSTDTESGETNPIPLRTTWNDTGAVSGPSEYYYCMRGVDTRDNKGYTSNIAGKNTMTFEKGYNDFSLPFEPFETIYASDMLGEDMFTNSADTLYKFHTGYQQWMGHPKFLPAEIDDFTLEMGEGYKLQIMEESLSYTFVGATGTAIRYIGGVGTESTFRDSLVANISGNHVQLNWISAANATHYNIYRASARMGADSLTDYSLQPVADVDSDTTTWTDEEATGDEYYYMVVAEDSHGQEMSGTYAVGLQKYHVIKGYTSFSFVLDPKPSDTIASFIDNFQQIDSIFYYDKNSGNWQGHANFLPENINNGNAVTGRGYMIYTSTDAVTLIIVGV